MSLLWRGVACAALAVILTSPASVKADTAVINFTTDVVSYSGTPALDPFNDNSIIDALINGEDGFFGNASPDWTRLAGQIHISDYTGPGTYSTSADGSSGVGVYLHGALLNRIETTTTRTGGPLTAESIALGAAPVDGDPSQASDDIYLPDFTPNGVASVTISEPTPGAFEVSVDYVLDFSTLPPENARFLREVPVSDMDPTGFRETALSANLDAVGAQFSLISIQDTAPAVVTSGGIGVSLPGGGFEDDVIPYGAFNPFDAIAAGNLSNTIAPTTRGVVRYELAAGNVLDGVGGSPIDDPLAGESGTAYFFDLTGAGDLAKSVELVPEPGAAALCVLSALGLVARRGRYSA